MTRWFSLRRRLLTLLLGGVALGWLVTLGFVYIETHHEVDELLEAGMIRHQTDNAHVREELTEELVESMLWPLFVGLPIIGLWVWFATRRGVAPLDDIADLVKNRGPSSLDPLVPETAPTEIQPLVEALNDLFSRVSHAFDNERRFTADASHELRTPLAALAAQAQVALRARDVLERDHAIEQIVLASQRASRLVEQLLTLARIDHPASNVGLLMKEVRFSALVAEVCADQGAAALAKNIVFELDAPTESVITGHADMLRILLRNLIDNALRYTPVGGHVAVRVSEEPTPVELTITDNGPGVPVEERDHLFERFHRLAGQETEGSGLGLSIVARIASLHHAIIELDNAPHGQGLQVKVRFRHDIAMINEKTLQPL
ncbi:MAG: ATP-binding protein [Rhodocyclaceae bacterium]|nr:ATP-binding protein [Rhodocyclaceae bacterium]